MEGSATPPAAVPSPFTTFRFRLEIETITTNGQDRKGPLRFWYQPTRTVGTISEFLNMLVDDIPVLRPYSQQLSLTMSGFALLPNAPTSLLRDGDVVTVTPFGLFAPAAYKDQVPVNAEGQTKQEPGTSQNPSPEGNGAGSAAEESPGEDQHSQMSGDAVEGTDADGALSMQSKRKRRKSDADPASQGEVDNAVQSMYAMQPIAGRYSIPEGHWADSLHQAAFAILPTGMQMDSRIPGIPMPFTEHPSLSHQLAHAKDSPEVQAAMQIIMTPNDGLPAQSPKDLDNSIRLALRKVAVAYDWKFRNLPNDLQTLISEDKLKFSKQCVMEFLKNSRPKNKVVSK